MTHERIECGARYVLMAMKSYLQSNRAAHPDAREAAFHDSTSRARTGGRER